MTNYLNTNYSKKFRIVSSGHKMPVQRKKVYGDLETSNCSVLVSVNVKRKDILWERIMIAGLIPLIMIKTSR